jgi:hypothetical protein
MTGHAVSRPAKMLMGRLFGAWLTVKGRDS